MPWDLMILWDLKKFLDLKVFLDLKIFWDLKNSVANIANVDKVDNVDSGEETYTSTLFLTEPLYQLLVCDNKSGCDNDLSESSNKQDSREKNIATMLQKTSRSSVQELLVSNTGQRSLWSDLPEVIESGILEKISNAERKLQEAIFEIISSEASYLKSLNVLINHFANSPKFVGDYAVLCPKDRVILFNDVYEVNQYHVNEILQN